MSVSETAIETFQQAKQGYDTQLMQITGLDPDHPDTPKMVNRYAQYIRNMEKQKNGWKFNPSRKPEPHCGELGCFFSKKHNRCVKNYKYSDKPIKNDKRCVCDENTKGQRYCRRTDVSERAKNRREFKLGKMKFNALFEGKEIKEEDSDDEWGVS